MKSLIPFKFSFYKSDELDAYLHMNLVYFTYTLGLNSLLIVAFQCR
jgi:hypothetical protein